jgi:hypothetical protein
MGTYESNRNYNHAVVRNLCGSGGPRNGAGEALPEDGAAFLGGEAALQHRSDTLAATGTKSLEDIEALMYKLVIWSANASIPLAVLCLKTCWRW